MLRLSPAVLVLVLAAGVLLSACGLGGTRTIVCDGTHPQWVLDARNSRGGCVETIPFDQAPENADWTPVCSSYCLCPQGELNMNGVCIAIAADQPWPSEYPYP